MVEVEAVAFWTWWAVGCAISAQWKTAAIYYTENQTVRVH
jgi:hypothetical protein